ncbi:hypothetical protein [Streptomyces fradiae]|uniref:hypothetical protein n=1 Tax=Streptomyces fradiae TaxID=1906 RepID=UPI0035BE5229
MPAHALAGEIDIAVLVPFAVGNVLYIAVADLLPEITTSPQPRRKVLHTASFVLGLAVLPGGAVLA